MQITQIYIPQKITTSNCYNIWYEFEHMYNKK